MLKAGHGFLSLRYASRLKTGMTPTGMRGTTRCPMLTEGHTQSNIQTHKLKAQQTRCHRRENIVADRLEMADYCATM